MKTTLFILLLLLASCTSVQEKIDDSTINLSAYLDNQGQGSISLSTLTDNIEYIPLQTPEELPIDILIAVKTSQEDIVVLDKSQNLLRFNKQGKFLNTIGKRGEGPEEYLNIINFDIEEKDSCVHVFDIHRHKVLTYQLNGTFIKSISIPNDIINLSIKDSLHFIGYQPFYLSKENIEKLVIFNQEGEKVHDITFQKNLDLKNRNVDIFRTAEFNTIPEGVTFRLPFENVSYLLTKNLQHQKDIEIRTEDYQLPLHIATQTEEYNKHLSSIYIFELNWHKLSDWVFISFFRQMENHRVLYNIQSKQFFTIFKGREPKGILNDIDEGVTFWPSWISNGKAIGVAYSEDLEEESDNSETKKKYEEFKKYDNPVLMIVNFKMIQP